MISKNNFIVFMFFGNKKTCLATIFRKCSLRTIFENSNSKNRKHETTLRCFHYFCSPIL